MTYRFVTNARPNGISSFAPSIWINVNTGKYYLSRDHKDEIIDRNKIDTSYMLIQAPKKPPQYSDFKNELKSIMKELTNEEIRLGNVRYKYESYRFTLNP